MHSRSHSLTRSLTLTPGTSGDIQVVVDAGVWTTSGCDRQEVEISATVGSFEL
eukprot:m.84373 g.84373  ORF g.84373 m.84373 type:complete len:53 (+) comp19709_c1_seq1:218-376(+)